MCTYCKVAIRKKPGLTYPAQPPFDPPGIFPEYPLASNTTDPTNAVYPMVRDLLALLEMDQTHYGTPQWNPLGDLVEPGDTVVIKPNFVTDWNREVEGLDAKLALVTHGAVLRPVIDFVYRACGRAGSIIVADTPLEEDRAHSFEEIVRFTGTAEMVQALQVLDVPVELVDLRSAVRSVRRGIHRQASLAGDPLGYSLIELGSNSAFSDIGDGRNTLETGSWQSCASYHNPTTHRYSIANTILSADAVINVPKLKTHKKAGVTLTLKNVMGISDRKDWIPHWRRGTDEKRGPDTFRETLVKNVYSWPLGSALASRLQRLLGVTAYGQGNWCGNDTIWRALIDLNKILLFADKQGHLCATPQRKYMGLVDGIIAGEKESPLAPSPRHFGAVIAGFDPVAIDTVCCQLMGIAPEKIRHLIESTRLDKYAYSHCHLDQIQIRGDTTADCAEPFAPASGWEPISMAYQAEKDSR
jgi:uncharacterized protein (DUF362 family)